MSESQGTVEPDEPTEVKALTDILARKPAGKERRPDPIILSWTDGTKSIACMDCGGKETLKPKCVACDTKGTVTVPREFRMTVTCHYPENPYGFQTAFLEASRTAQTPEVNDAGVETYPNEDIDLLHLTQGLVDSPVWLKNRSALKQFKAGVPSPVVGSLQRKLMLVGGLDADFFSDSQAFMAPALWNRLASESRNASATPPSKPQPSPNGTSPPSTTTTGPAGMKSASTGLPTTSGSSESTPTTDPPTPAPQPIPATATS